MKAFPIAQPGAPDPLPLIMIVAACLEIGGGALLTVGLFTRPVAFILAGEMAVAYFAAHFPHSPWPGVNQERPFLNLLDLLLSGVRLVAGSWSLDAAIRRRT